MLPQAVESVSHVCQLVRLFVSNLVDLLLPTLTFLGRQLGSDQFSFKFLQLLLELDPLLGHLLLLLLGLFLPLVNLFSGIPFLSRYFCGVSRSFEFRLLFLKLLNLFLVLFQVVLESFLLSFVPLFDLLPLFSLLCQLLGLICQENSNFLLKFSDNFLLALRITSVGQVLHDLVKCAAPEYSVKQL